MGDRLVIYEGTQIAPPDPQELIRGLSSFPKTIPAYYFYDDQGSALFEQICRLPEYYLTRTETEILRDYADPIARITQAKQLIELGSGSATKTRILLTAFDKYQPQFTYVPIDISGGILQDSANNLLAEYPALTIYGIIATYQVALTQLPTRQGDRLFCFLGSSLGNFNAKEAKQLFSQIASAMDKGDYFLLGIDCHKDAQILYSAYNDSAQITAKFNLNMLANINNLFDGDLQIDQFSHRAIYNEQSRQIEMYLISHQPQTFTLKKLGLAVELNSGEMICTEISRKFIPAELCQELAQVGLQTVDIFCDRQNWYALLLCQL